MSREVPFWAVRLASTGALVGIMPAKSFREAGARGASIMKKRGRALETLAIRRALATRDDAWVSRESVESIHEASHTIAALDLGLTVSHVTIVDEHGDGAGGTCEVAVPRWLLRFLRAPPTRLRPTPTRGHEQHDPERRALIRHYIIQGVAGRAGERRLVKRPPPRDDGPGSDAHDARLCAELLGVRGKRIAAFVRSLEREADAILERRWAEVVLLAGHLEARWTMRRIGATDLARIIAEARAARE